MDKLNKTDKSKYSSGDSGISDERTANSRLGSQDIQNDQDMQIIEFNHDVNRINIEKISESPAQEDTNSME